MSKFENLPNIAVPVTPELKQRIRDVNREAIALHTAVFPVVYVRAKVSDVDTGNVTSDSEYKANSFNRNFWNYITYILTGTYSDNSAYGEGYINLKNRLGGLEVFGGTYTSELRPLSSTSQNAPIGLMYSLHEYNGISIGTGTDAEDFNGYNVTNLINHGTSSGQMSYQSPTHSSVVSYNSTTKIYSSDFFRTFKNLSGESISVTETMLYIYGASVPKFIIERTLLPETKTVNNNQQIEVTYTFEFTFPEPA